MKWANGGWAGGTAEWAGRLGYLTACSTSNYLGRATVGE